MQGDDMYLQFQKKFYSMYESVRYMNMSGNRKCRPYKKYKCLQNSAVDGLEGVCTKSLVVCIWKSQKLYFKGVTRKYATDMTTDPSFRQTDRHKHKHIFIQQILLHITLWCSEADLNTVLRFWRSYFFGVSGCREWLWKSRNGYSCNSLLLPWIDLPLKPILRHITSMHNPISSFLKIILTLYSQ